MPIWAWSLAALAAAGLALLAALGPVLSHWRRRRVVWMSDAAELLAPAPKRAFAPALVLCAALVAVLAGLQGFAAWPTPFAFLLAGFACATVGHTQAILPAGVAGLGLFGVSIVAAAAAWLPAPLDRVNVNLFLGCAAAAAHAGWLARFWRQQLLEGAPWTTSGRLIPAAAAVGMVFLVAAIAEAGRLATATAGLRMEAGAVPLVRTILGGLLLLGAVLLAARNAADWQRGWKAAAAVR